MNFNSAKDVTTFLDSIPKFSEEGAAASDFSLERFKAFCESIGNPQNEFASVHVTGSNGKGSTCNVIASIYKQAGFKTGLYTSPHLLSIRERFKINGAQIYEKTLVRFFQKYYSRVKSFRLTYFEITTAIAFWWFAEKSVDIGVIETGLGGRLDATNVITPRASVITSVSLDHTDILGDTIKEIAREKAGIIKQGVPVFVGHVPPEAMKQIEEVALAKDSPVKKIDELKPELQSGTFKFKTNTNRTETVVPFKAPVQAFNIALAWQVCEALNEIFDVSERQIRKGLREAGSKENQPGRFEKLHPSYRWYFDGAHNVEAVRAMKEAVRTAGRVEEAVLVFSLMRDKMNKKLEKELLEFKKIVYYTPSTKRGAKLDEVIERLPHAKPFPVDITSRHSFLDEVKLELVIFGGSFYFYPTVKNWITTYL